MLTVFTQLIGPLTFSCCLPRGSSNIPPFQGPSQHSSPVGFARVLLQRHPTTQCCLALTASSMVRLRDLLQQWSPLQPLSLMSIMSVSEILDHSNLMMYHLLNVPQESLLSLHSRFFLPRIFPRLCHCIIRLVVRPDAFEPRSARVQQCVKRLASQAATLLLHHCPLAANQVLDLLQVPLVLQKSFLDGSVSVYAVGIRDEVFVRPPSPCKLQNACVPLNSVASCQALPRTQRKFLLLCTSFLC